MTTYLGGVREGTPIPEKKTLTHQTRERPIYKPGRRKPSKMNRTPLSPNTFVPPAVASPTEQSATIKKVAFNLTARADVNVPVTNTVTNTEENAPVLYAPPKSETLGKSSEQTAKKVQTAVKSRGWFTALALLFAALLSGAFAVLSGLNFFKD